MNVIWDSLATVRLGAPQVHRNLALFPLVAAREHAAGYVLLDEALERKLARVTGVAEGSLPELAFENASAEKILLVDGDELAGAEQSRIVERSILVGAGRTVAVPVSRGQRRRRAQAELEAYAAALRPEPRQRGAVLAIDGKAVGLELFDSATAFFKHLRKLVLGYAFDALATANGKSLCPSEDEVRRFVDALLTADAEEHAAPGEGQAIRLTGARVAGGALAAQGRLIHLACCALAREI